MSSQATVRRPRPYHSVERQTATPVNRQVRFSVPPTPDLRPTLQISPNRSSTPNRSLSTHNNDNDSETSESDESSLEDEEDPENDDSEEAKIPKPEGEAGRPGRGGYTLESVVQWNGTEFGRLKVGNSALQARTSGPDNVDFIT